MDEGISSDSTKLSPEPCIAVSSVLKLPILSKAELPSPARVLVKEKSVSFADNMINSDSHEGKAFADGLWAMISGGERRGVD